MNATLLLVTTAWLAGADAAPADAAKTTAPAVTSGDCGACCDSGHEGMWGRLRGCFHRDHGDSCNPCPAPALAPCPTAKPAPCPTHQPSCGCERESCLTRLRNCFRRSECGECNPCAPAHAAPAPCPHPAPAPAACGPSCGACCEETLCSKLRGKLRGCFHRDHGCGSECAPGCGPGNPGEPIKAPKDGEPDKKLPKGDKEAAIPANTNITPVSAGSETKSPFELSPRYESRAGHAPDYSWLTGQLFYVHADGGLWVLRYAPLSTEDSNGGGVVIARDLNMDSYRNGDLVTVHGQLLGQKSSIFLGGPLYQGRTIELVERESEE